MSGPRVPVVLFLALLLAGCTAPPIQRNDGSTSVRSFSVRDLAKSDIDSVVEIHQQEIIATLRNIALKLYRRNPAEWRKGGHASAEDAVEALFRPLNHWHLSSLQKLPWQSALRDPWRPDFDGDRVRALMQGLLVMQMAAFNNQTEFYILSELDAQKLYNAARNTEAVVWKLSNARDERGAPILLSNSMAPGEVPNLSLEREFGKLVGIQDALAKVVEDKTNRAIRFGVVNVATMVFLPI